MDSTIRASRRDPSTGLAAEIKRLRQSERLDDFEPEALTIDGETYDASLTSGCLMSDARADGVAYVEVYHLGPGEQVDAYTDWYLCRDAEAAGAFVRARWAEMVEDDPEEFRHMVGSETLIAWALGRSAGPERLAALAGKQPDALRTHVSSLTEWLDLTATAPEEELASYDGEECEVERVGSELVEKLGFVPTVAYRVN